MPGAMQGSPVIPDCASLHPGYAGFPSLTPTVERQMKKPDGASHPAFLCLEIGIAER